MTNVGKWIGYVGMLIESAGILTEYVRLGAKCVRLLMEYVGISIQTYYTAIPKCPLTIPTRSIHIQTYYVYAK